MVNLRKYYAKIINKLSPYRIHQSHDQFDSDIKICALYSRTNLLLVLIGQKKDIKQLLEFKVQKLRSSQYLTDLVQWKDFSGFTKDYVQLNEQNVQIVWPWNAKTLIKRSKQIKHIRNHEVDWPEINNADNFVFQTPDALDNFLRDLHYGDHIIQDIQNQIQKVNKMSVVI